MAEKKNGWIKKSNTQTNKKEQTQGKAELNRQHHRDTLYFFPPGIKRCGEITYANKSKCRLCKQS
jgi:hypothetical protein